MLKGCSRERATGYGSVWEAQRADRPLLCRGAGVLEQLRRPRDPEVVTSRSRVAAGGAVTDRGQSISHSDVRTDDLETAGAPVLCG